jgi:PAS domain S-box-containing protein
MNQAPDFFTRRHLRGATWLFFALMTLAVAASAFWSVYLLRDAVMKEAERDDRNNFDRDALYLLNPAAMSWETHELKSHADGTLGHITSLKPLNPKNAPDAWETAALRSFEQGRTEVLSRELYQGRPYLRFMKPVITETFCLQCHAAQGYRKGDIRGGISVAVPLAPYLESVQVRTARILAAHAGLWALGALGVFLVARKMRQRLDRQLQAEAALRESELRFRILFEKANDGMMLADTETKRFTLVNRQIQQMLGYSEAELLQLTVMDIHPAAELAAVLEQFARLAREEISLITNIPMRRKDGSVFYADISASPVCLNQRDCLFGIFRDITARQQAEAERERLIAELRQAMAEIKTMSGLIPICSGCKKIRDDKGYWNQVESYLAKHTDAKFTHGLCPDCTKIYFPGLEEDGSADPPKEAL